MSTVFFAGGLIALGIVALLVLAAVLTGGTRLGTPEANEARTFAALGSAPAVAVTTEQREMASARESRPGTASAEQARPFVGAHSLTPVRGGASEQTRPLVDTHSLAPEREDRRAQLDRKLQELVLELQNELQHERAAQHTRDESRADSHMIASQETKPGQWGMQRFDDPREAQTLDTVHQRMQGTTGRFSLLPTDENAGNSLAGRQPIPVTVTVDGDMRAYQLPTMSVEIRIHVH